MEGIRSKWQVWIDTGGTFTDCIAKSPDGKWHRRKVLSTGRLRGNIIQKKGTKVFYFDANWNIQVDLFKGYTIRFLDQEEQFTHLVKMDFELGILETETALQFNQPTAFEITAFEEAPILATRLITQTSLNQSLPSLDMRLGSTKGTNALLEKKGAKLYLLITRGFKDLIAIGTQQRPDLFQLNIPPPDLLFTEAIEVDERLDAKGEIIQALEEKEIVRIVQLCKKKNIDTVAIALLHAYRNPIHEQQLAKALLAAGLSYVSTSAALSPAINILPRAHTAIVNAYLSPVIDQYLQGIKTSLNPKVDLEKKISDTTLKVMTSAGGLIDAQYFQAKDSLLSGPAGGIVGAARVARQMGMAKILTLDMGGTSTDTARYDHAFDYQFTTRVGSAELLSPTLAIETVAAGGGSICSFDGIKLCVGPKSAGADPGPACYGAGGPLTITDVNLLLGRMDGTKFGIPLEMDQSVLALQQLSEQIHKKSGESYTYLELLSGLEQIANEKMAEAIRKISVAKGFDPRDYALLVFGGAGGLHACSIAELLEVSTIILPFDAGILSAYGIGHAQIERLAEQQVLKLLTEAEPQLSAEITRLENNAIEKLKTEGFSKAEIQIKHVYLYLRFTGQTSSLEIDIQSLALKTLDNIRDRFKEKYIALFGHWPENKAIELESIKIMVASKEDEDSVIKPTKHSFVAKPVKFIFPILGSDQEIPAYDWETLQAGAQLKGPAVLMNKNATAYIKEHWQLEIDENRNAKLQLQTKTKTKITEGKKAIELELFTNRFMAIAEEMGAQLKRTAFSVNIKERLDFSCAILDANAELLVNAPHIPVHLGSLGICTRLVREQLELGPGDVVITNHPKFGGSHLPDVNLISAVFSKNGTRIGYVINRAHHAEIGGSRPGSMPPDAQNLAEEGVVIAPMYLVEKGVIHWQRIETLLRDAAYPSRSIVENISDINAALASLKTGETALKQLVETYGLIKVHYYMEALKESANTALWKALLPLQGQDFQAREQLDDGHEIQVAIHISKTKLTIDFSGTSAVHPFNLNANISIVYSAVIYVLRLLCNESIPLNEGLMKQVDIQLPTCFLNPDFSDNDLDSPAVVGGNTECSQRLVDTLLKAFGLVACSQGTMNNFLFGNESFGYYETIGGGCGAGLGFAGRSAIHQHMTNTKITDPEELEFRYPVRLRQFAIRKKSGGKGKWNGGDGIIREFEFLKPVEVTLISQHRKESPYGLEGGAAGKRGKQYLIKKNGEKIKIKGIDQASLELGDRILIKTPGGGGFGRPVND